MAASKERRCPKCNCKELNATNNLNELKASAFLKLPNKNPTGVHLEFSLMIS
jgi:hypothetical protein